MTHLTKLAIDVDRPRYLGKPKYLARRVRAMRLRDQRRAARRFQHHTLRPVEPLSSHRQNVGAQAEPANHERIPELEPMLNGRLDAEADRTPRSLISEPREALPLKETMLRFMESAEGTLSALEVQTDDRSGLLSILSRALFQQAVQIESLELRSQGHRVFDRFRILEHDGSPIGPERWLDIQVAVLSAIGLESPRSSPAVAPAR
jgi:hypothetical protein